MMSQDIPLGFQVDPRFVPQTKKITLTFPDGARREFPQSITGFDIAKEISPSLLKRSVAMVVDGALADLFDPIDHDAKIEFIARDDPRALDMIRHDAAHVMAEAVQTLWPGTQVTIGPVIENGFYYDFFRNEAFTPDDFDAIEKKMREIIARDKPFTKEVWSRDGAKRVFRDKGELFKVELVDAIPEGEPIKIYKQGEWFDLCRGPHMTSTGKVGNAFKLMKVAGAYWRGDHRNPMLTRIYGTAWAKPEDLAAYLKQIEEAEKRDHRRLGREMNLSGADRLYAPPAERRRLYGSERAAAARQVAVGDFRPLGMVSREHVRGAIGGR
jgi:threonyl-tRNA synthetase